MGGEKRTPPPTCESGRTLPSVFSDLCVLPGRDHLDRDAAQGCSRGSNSKPPTGSVKYLFHSPPPPPAPWHQIGKLDFPGIFFFSLAILLSAMTSFIFLVLSVCLFLFFPQEFLPHECLFILNLLFSILYKKIILYFGETNLYLFPDPPFSFIFQILLF